MKTRIEHTETKVGINFKLFSGLTFSFEIMKKLTPYLRLNPVLDDPESKTLVQLIMSKLLSRHPYVEYSQGLNFSIKSR